ncbi:MAG TPA: ATP-binding cassette domain-containing protein [Chitinophagales bacterium]|nr:ATP-binding cassette domain-containing protein [Chitinophagales bacterium]
MSVTVSGLTKIYGEQHAVDNITFEVKPGDVLGFLGPNGAGKSTTMKIISGFIPPSEGKASVCGFDVETNSFEAKKNIGYLPENNPLYTEMYVKEFLLFTGKLNHVQNIRARVKEMVSIVGLESEQRKKIGALSKGYRQRVGLAQALLHDPRVLIMDEPTSGLDPNQLVGMRQLIKDLGKEKTVILSTHIMQEVQSICNRVVIINKGKIVADDTVENLQSRNSEEVVIRVTFKNSISKNLLQQIKGVVKIEDVDATTFRFHSSFNNEEDIFRYAVENKNIITSMQHEMAGLEEIFRELTNEKN